MIDLVKAQQDLTYALAGADRLLYVNVKSYRQMLISKQAELARLVEDGRGPLGEGDARNGVGVLVLMPTGLDKNTGVSGPVLDWVFPVVVVECPEINMLPESGTLKSAEEVVQDVMDAAHLLADDLYGTFQSQGFAPETQYVFPGCLGYRANFKLSAGKSLQTDRVKAVRVVAAGDEVTLATDTADAQIYYTMDGSSPSRPEAGNPASLLYTDPVPAPSGAVIRAAAFKAGMNQSAARYYAAP